MKACYKTSVKDGDFQEVAINSSHAKYIEKEIPRGCKRKELKKYVPQLSSGRVVDIYDGDTFTIAGRVAYNPELFQFQVRVNGIDTPEKKTHNENEKYVANIAKEFVKEKIMDKVEKIASIVLPNQLFEKL